jgi:hypothetical protein
MRADIQRKPPSKAAKKIAADLFPVYFGILLLILGNTLRALPSKIIAFS